MARPSEYEMNPFIPMSIADERYKFKNAMAVKARV
jgi:hypothetical protein